MISEPRHERPDEGKAFAEPEGVPKIVEEIVEHVEAVLAPVHADASHREPDGDDDSDDVLNRRQLAALHHLVRLHRTLRGPQALLETAGNFNRPFPPGRVFGRQGG